MSGLLYFLPKATREIKAADAAAAGIGYAIDDRLTPSQCQNNGPGGCGGGVVLADCRRVESHLVRFLPEKQIWRKIPGTDAWVGRRRDGPTGPQDLQRADSLGGHFVKLLDGNDWLVPVARGWNECDGELRWFYNVPRALELDEDGKWQQGGVLPRFAEIWDLALRWEESRRTAAIAAGDDDTGDGTGDKIVTFDFQDTIAAAVTALAVNYAIGPAEAALLGLLSEELANEVLDALIDLPTRTAWFSADAHEDEQKKTAAAGGSTSAGSAAATRATGLP